ncbi:hypothetical protein MHYP_G00281810 [Metynnis hypsauchen]
MFRIEEHPTTWRKCFRGDARKKSDRKTTEKDGCSDYEREYQRLVAEANGGCQQLCRKRLPPRLIRISSP